MPSTILNNVPQEIKDELSYKILKFFELAPNSTKNLSYQDFMQPYRDNGHWSTARTLIYAMNNLGMIDAVGGDASRKTSAKTYRVTSIGRQWMEIINERQSV